MSPTLPPIGAILAGGESLRFSGGDGLPKALAPLGASPMVLHVAAGLVCGGAGRIVVLTGRNHARVCAGLGLDPLSTGAPFYVQCAGRPERTVPFEVRFSGERAGTGGRLLCLTPEEMAGGALVSYSDILTDAPLARLWESCVGGIDLCLLAVNPPAPWGEIRLGQDDTVIGFAEKPVDPDRWINGGVMAMSGEVQKRVGAEAEMLEHAPMQRLVEAGRVRALRHRGAWRAVDTPKDLRAAEAALADATADWKIWDRAWLDTSQEA